MQSVTTKSIGKQYEAACSDREKAAEEYRSKKDKKERLDALVAWQAACAIVHQLEEKHPKLKGPTSR